MGYIGRPPLHPLGFGWHNLNMLEDTNRLKKRANLEAAVLIAAEISDRVCYGMELDPKYCDVIIERFAKYTGIPEREIRRSAK